jgi:hypothetical protein
MKNQLERRVARISAYVKSVESLLEKAKEKNTSSRVVMLERAHLPLSYNCSTREYFVEQVLRPQLFDPERAKRISKSFETKDGKTVVVTEIQYYEARLGDAKALLITYTKKETPESVKTLKKKIKSLKLQYAALESRERKGKTGLGIQRGILITQKLLKAYKEDISRATKTK